MKDKYEKIKVPKALEHLIIFSNDELQRYQQELLQRITESSEEIMKILNISSEDGWQLNLSTFEYVKVITPVDETDAPLGK